MIAEVVIGITYGYVEGHSSIEFLKILLYIATSLKNGFGAVVAAPIEYEPCIDASAIEFLDELKIGLIIKHNMASP